MMLPSASGGRTWMETISGICPCRSLPVDRGRLLLCSRAQQGNQLSALCALGVGRDGLVGDLMRAPLVGIIRMHGSRRCASDLLRGSAPTKQGADDEPRAFVRGQLGPWPGASSA